MQFKNKVGQEMANDERWIWGSIAIFVICTGYVVGRLIWALVQ